MASLSDDAPHLDPPPRRVAPALQLVTLFGGVRSCAWMMLFLASCGLGASLETLLDRFMVVWSAVAVAVFCAVTAFCVLLVITAVREGLEERWLLVHGEFAVGRVTADKPLGPKCSRLTLEVTRGDGGTHEVAATAYLDDFAEARPARQLLYDPVRGDRTLLLDNGGASHPPQLDGRGGFRKPALVDVLIAVAIPLGVLVVPVRSMLALLLRLAFPHAG